MGGAGSQFSFMALFHQGGVAMYPLLLCSVLALAVGLERLWVLWRTTSADSLLAERLRGLLSGRRVQEAAEACQAQDSALGRVVHEAITLGKGDPKRREKVLQRALTRETGRLERGMAILATIGSVAPFVGLFGTVLGIMRAFRDIGSAGSAGGAIVAAGIAEALITTAAGLFVAVLAVVAYNHLMTWIQNTITNTELSAEDLLSLLDD